MSAPNPAFKDLFPPTHYPLLRLLGLFIDLYQVMQADPSEDFTDAYQDWFEEWWNFWTREFGGLRTPIAAFYATRWWRLTADDERGRMCAMLENYIAEARRGRLEPHMLVIPTGSCKDPWRRAPREEEQLYMRDFKTWSSRQRNAVASRKYRGGAEAPRHHYAVPNIAFCARLRSEGQSLVPQFEPWNPSGVEYSVTHARRANPAPQVAHSSSPLPPVPMHSSPPTSTVDPPAFLEPPVHFSSNLPNFRSLAHITPHNVLDRYSHRQRAIYGLD
ncbi:Salivary gland secretion 1 [Rhodotorula toruloides ATCC 204091]|uniref:Salivary gland secretion 1 n=1 Tax=Rhodotorula toruloides TaxID=5286 RepID=A0A0K3CD02_RHOTO|nr:Salivary gland secretion 1 [Rhodotorula toruloides ATCC 204091]KAK4330957.1 Salivary gland secretion 1 [Rhodotorula toruloides]PRQ75524.1 salivary gland secretion 1 [Rhodotorula toruloides]